MPTNRAEVRAKLRIDDSDIDASLVEQPEYFFQAGEQAVIASAVFRALKIELKEVTAELVEDIRRRALAADEKITEAGLNNQVTILPRIKQLQQKLLAAEKSAEDWGVLKDAYIQRSHTLRELNASQLARFYNLGVERGAVSNRRNIGDRNRAEIDRMRIERYRPRDQGD